ncbi:MAG: hypothetical protein ACUVR3_10495 [Candidatus Roseilinea sp.]
MFTQGGKTGFDKLGFDKLGFDKLGFDKLSRRLCRWAGCRTIEI